MLKKEGRNSVIVIQSSQFLDETKVFSMTIKIKFATTEDVPLIFTFIKELAEYEKLSHEVVATEELLKKALFGEKSNTEALIAYLDEQPVAFALFFHNFSTFAGRPGIYLEDLFVRPEARGKNIGKALLTFLAKLAIERNCARLEWSVLDWNEPAIGFYKRLGAKAMDEWTVYRVTGPALQDLAQQA